MMYPNIVIATVVLVLQFRPATACATAGMSLSSDNQYCFGYISLEREWNFHTVLCDMYGAKLAKIDSAEKQTLVETYLTSQSITSSEKVFIGLTNILGDPSNWVWFGGNITSYTNWATSEPVSTYRYHCAYMLASDKKWYNDNCLNGNYGLCEREATAADLD